MLKHIIMLAAIVAILPYNAIACDTDKPSVSTETRADKWVKERQDWRREVRFKEMYRKKLRGKD